MHFVTGIIVVKPLVLTSLGLQAMLAILCLLVAGSSVLAAPFGPGSGMLPVGGSSQLARCDRSLFALCLSDT